MGTTTGSYYERQVFLHLGTAQAFSNPFSHLLCKNKQERENIIFGKKQIEIYNDF